MSSEKRFFLFLVLAFGSAVGIQFVMEKTGLIPPPAKNAPVDADAKDETKPDETANGQKPRTEENKLPDLPADVFRFPDEPPQVSKPQVERVDPRLLVLGSARDKSPGGYRLEVLLDQDGAGVGAVLSSRYESEFQGKIRHRPLQLIRLDFQAPPSLGLTLVSLDGEPAPDAPKSEIPLDRLTWAVVKDAQGRIVRPVPADAASESEEQGQEIVFTTTVGTPALRLEKTFRLLKGTDGFEMTLKFESPDKDRAVVYKLLGPHGIPIEGEWYTGTFRDAFFGQYDNGKLTIAPKTADQIVKEREAPEKYQSRPIKLAGIENQYFAVFFMQGQDPLTPENRWDSETIGIVIHEDPKARQKADIGVEMTSRPVPVGPNLPATQTYKVFAGPKTVDALRPFGATELASYRKSSWIPGAGYVANVISPLLDSIYGFTRTVASLFGARSGNYGVSIILLTLLVRLLMFPLSRKQAIAAKKMQDLQPLLKEIQAKYKDDKERQTKETFALYNKHGVNPIGGCLPALIQLPIFVGLWQALNTSVSLRHASFLYIQDLAAPDMLFRFPWGETPFLGYYFNLLPFLVVALMLVQTKLFSPPPTTPEAEMQQKMMKYMMIFMAFMFYKVPSGLGIYFITSSLWQIGERLLLPKVAAHASSAGKGGDDTGGGGGGGGGGGNGAPPKPPGRFSQFFDKILEEAKKDPTYRKMTEERDQGRSKGKDKGRDGDRDRRDKGKPRARPGKRR